MEEESSAEWKTCPVNHFIKRNVLRLDLMESREGFCSRGRGRSFHAEAKDRKGVGTNSGMSGASAEPTCRQDLQCQEMLLLQLQHQTLPVGHQAALQFRLHFGFQQHVFLLRLF